MRKRAEEMPVDDVVVYCVSCIKAMQIGGRQPRYMVDLLFGGSTPKPRDMGVAYLSTLYRIATCS